MAMLYSLLDGFHLRTRLLRRVTFRLWKSFALSSAKPLVQEVRYEVPDQSSLSMPAIILSSFSKLSDFLILSHLFRDKELTLIMPRSLPKDKDIDLFRSINHVLYLEDRVGYKFFREILMILRDFNRCIVISPDAAKRYVSHVPVDPGVVAKIAMLANVPIVPVVLQWDSKKRLFNGRSERCTIWIGKRIYISPRNEEFKDIFFKRRGVRKFVKLPQEDLIELGGRIFSKLKGPGEPYGANLPEELAKRVS